MEQLEFAELRQKTENAIATTNELAEALRGFVKEFSPPSIYAQIHQFPTSAHAYLTESIGLLEKNSDLLTSLVDPYLTSQAQRIFPEIVASYGRIEQFFRQLLPNAEPTPANLEQVDSTLGGVIGLCKSIHEIVVESETRFALLRLTKNQELMAGLSAEWQATFKAKSQLADKTINKLKTESKSILERLEAKVADQDVIEIKEFYNDEKLRETERIFWLNVGFYVSFIVMIVEIVGAGLYHYNVNTGDLFSRISVSVVLVTLLGFTTFFMTDLRKRLNISRGILDELRQKIVLADTYSVLLGKARENQGQVKFSQDLLNNIIEQLLVIRNHGYTGKDMMTHSPYPVMELLSKAMDKIKPEGK